MTVYSVNKRVLEQATNMTPANAKAGNTAAEFAALLGSSTGRFGASNLPAADKALGKSLDRPVRDARETKPADKPERAEAKPVERDSRRGEGKATERADKAQPRDKAPAKDAKVEQPAEEAEAAPDTAAAEPAAEAEQSVAEQPAADVDAAAVTQVTEAQPQVAVAAPVATQIVADTTGNDGEQAAAGLANQTIEAGADASNGDDAAADNAAAQAAGDAAQSLAAAPTKAAAKTDSHGRQQNAADAGGDLAAQQAEELAASLAGTGAQLAVKVNVANGAQKTTTDTAATTAATPLDLLLAQDVGAQDIAATGQSAGGQNGSQNPGVATAAQQVAANGALENALAASGKAVEAKPFAAALAAQMDAGGTPQASGGSGQQAQPVAGLNGASGTQAATKAAPAQAAHAPRQPQATPEQVMDQVTVEIAKQAKDGHDTIKVQLKPVELGHIEVKLDIAQDGRVTGVVTADNKDTLAILQKDSRGLEKALEDAGFKAESGSLTFNLREGNQQANEGNTQGRSRRSRAMAAGIDGIGGPDGAAQPQARWSGNRSGVDIKV